MRFSKGKTVPNFVFILILNTIRQKTNFVWSSDFKTTFDFATFRSNLNPEEHYSRERMRWTPARTSSTCCTNVGTPNVTNEPRSSDCPISVEIRTSGRRRFHRPTEIMRKTYIDSEEGFCDRYHLAI
jgi:hypothetical protein